MTLPSRPPVTLDDRYSARSGTVVMSGIQALVRSALDIRRLDQRQGLDSAVFVSGYQGSPLGGVDREFIRARAHLEPLEVVFRPGLNEELAATAVAGTQLVSSLEGRRYDGVTGIWFGKNPGLDRAADAMRHANISGTSPAGGAVAWIGDDPSSKSSTVPSSCEPMCRSLLMPLLAPGTVEEALRFALHAVGMSRYSGLWTGLKIVADVADSSTTVRLDDLLEDVGQVAGALADRPPARPPVLLPPANLDAELDAMTARLDRAREYGLAAGLNGVWFEPRRPRLAVVAAGVTHQAVVRALSDLGLDDGQLDRHGIRVIQIGMPWPLDGQQVRDFSAGVDRVLVVEDKLPFLESLFKEHLYGTASSPQVLGKYDQDGAPLLAPRAALGSDEVIAGLRRLLPDLSVPAARPLAGGRRRELKLLPDRTPTFCSGCPHSVSTRAHPDQLVGVGIGCHVMVALEETSRRGTLVGMTQMGGEGTQWLGIQPFVAAEHFIQNIGDGTFYHSGSLALRASVAAGVNITYRLLFNDAVAMTGGQEPTGRMDLPTLTHWLANEGVQQVVITTATPKALRRAKLDPIARVEHRSRLDAVQRELAAVQGVTVLLHVDRCATEERRLRKRGRAQAPKQRLWINERVCEGCGDCGEKSTCLSVIPVQTDHGRKTRIHQSSCNQDFSCLKGDCPSFLSVIPGNGRPRPAVPSLPGDMLTPALALTGDLLIRMPGIGGTGVVTVSAVLQMAAHLDGLHVGGLEQIGMSQKGGPVISDLRLSPQPVQGQLRAGEGTVDILLAFDALGASTEHCLRSLRQTATAVVNTAEVPTARMIQDPAVTYPAPGQLRDRIEAAAPGGRHFFLDAQQLAEKYFDDHMPTNMVLLGAAFQHGVLPLTAQAIEEAVRLNAVAVDTNLDAFRLGRLAVGHPELLADPAEVLTGPSDRAVSQASAVVAAREEATRLARMVDDLERYQNRRYADQYLDRVRALSDQLAGRPDREASVIRYAQGLYRLMAYKDEYEVARLHLDAAERARLEAQFGADATVRIMLHPPVLRALGLQRKLALGSWILPVLRGLRALRFVRATALDPFGRTEVRRTERSLAAEFDGVVHAVLARTDGLAEEALARALDLPEMVRGYEDVKMRNVRAFRQEAHRLVSTPD